jgi:nicotinamide riboside kinase
MTERKSAVLILGMHRSGTSAMTRMLNLLGAELGSRLMPAVSNNNENGFWENQTAVDINEALLAELGSNWHDIREMPAGWLQSGPALRARAAIRRLIDTEFAAAPLWALKDPRLCRLAPLWLDVLKEYATDVHIVIALRAPDEVAASLLARDGWSNETSRLMWVQHMREAERASRGYPRSVVTFDEVMADWYSTTQRLALELSLSWPVAPSAVAAEIEAFINPSARHHRSEGLAAVTDSSWPGQLYAAFLRARDEPAAWDDIATIGDAYDRAASTFAPCVAELTRQLREMDELRHYFQTLHGNGVAELQIARRALAAEAELLQARDALTLLSGQVAQMAQQQLQLQLSFAVMAQRAEESAVDAARRADVEALRTLLQHDIERRERENAIRDGVLGETAKQIDLQVLGDGLAVLAQQVDALNQRGLAARWRRWSGG